MKPLTGMKRTSCFALLLATIATACLVAGCSGNGSPVESLALPGGATQAQMRLGNSLARIRPGVSLPEDVAVSDFGFNYVLIFDSTLYYEEGDIGPLPSNPDALWYDNAENLYVVEPYAAQVEEFPDGAYTPSFTYSLFLTHPFGVTTDSTGAIYVADAGNGSHNTENVLEYAQAGKYPIAICNTGQSNAGVAVDSSGEVFVSGNTALGARVVVFKGGLSGCNATVLKVKLNSSTESMGLDSHGNLAVVDHVGVEVIKPPYTSISLTCGKRYTTVSRFVSFNRTQDLLFVSDVGSQYVWVFNWPACTLFDVMVPQLTGSGGIGGVAASINPGE